MSTVEAPDVVKEDNGAMKNEAVTANESVALPKTEQPQEPAAQVSDPATSTNDGEGTVESAGVKDEESVAKEVKQETSKGEEKHTSIGPESKVKKENDDEPAVSKTVHAEDDDDDDEDLFGGDDDDDEPNNGAAAVAPVQNENPVSVEQSEETKVKAEESVIASDKQVTEPSEPDKTSTTSIAIPRKVASQAMASPPSNPTKTSSNINLASFGLPEGVNVPLSVEKGKLLNNNPNNKKMMDTLRGLPVNLINDALTEYDDAAQIKGNAIRNHGAYLYGVVKRYVSVHERSSTGGEGSGILPMGEGLSIAVNARLEQLVSSGFCTSEEMNEKVKSKIRMLSEKDALFALDELSSVSRSQIRNFGSYFMGILNRYMRGDSASKTPNNQSKTGTSATQYHQPHTRQPQIANTHNQQQQQQQQQQQRGRLPRDSFNKQHSFNNRDRSRDRLSGSNDSNRRFQPASRDSMNNAFNPSNMNQPTINQNNLGQPLYDNRQQQQPWQNQSHLQQNPTIRPPNLQTFQQQQQPPPPPQQQQPASYPSAPQYNPMYQQNMMQQQQQQQQPPQQSPQTPSMTFVQQPGYPPSQLQQQQPPPQPQYHPQSHLMGNQPYSPAMSSQQPQQPYMQPQMNQPQGQPVYGMNQQQGQTPQMQQTWQQQQVPGQVDIMGLADKAASAVQALSANQSQSRGPHNMMQQRIVAPPPPQQPQQTYGQQQPYQQQSYPGNVMSPGNQAMSYQQQQQVQQQIPLQQQQQQRNINSNYGNRNKPAGQGYQRRPNRRLDELPIAVQYSVQNLVATNAIEGQLDEGILGMIFDLPEYMALAALQKFASIDKNTMRNKTAYLAGCLKRELEKVSKR